MNINLFALSGVLTFISTLALGLFTWIKRRNKAHKLWAFYNFVAAIWGFGAFKFSTTLDKGEVFFWLYLSHIGVIFIPVFFLHFSLEFLEQKKEYLIKLVYMLGIAFLILNITDWLGLTRVFIVNIRYVFNSFYVDSPPGPVYPFFVAFFFLSVGYAFYCGLKKLKISSGINKLQIKYFLIAMGIGFLGGGTAFFMVFEIDIYPYGHLLVALYPIIITYAIVKYRLMDINIAITRGVVFGFVYLCILSVPFIIGFWGREFVYLFLGDIWWILPVVVGVILASMGPSVYLGVKEKAEWALFKQQKQYQQTLLKLGRQMTLTKNINEL
ncbi:MAG: histidine kinase N-terminal 7TM domain-containing protein, partial [Elusimicrobiota bacterium]